MFKIHKKFANMKEEEEDEEEGGVVKNVNMR